MGICFRCEREVSRLFDSIVEEGIVGLCEDCIEDVPRVKRPPEFLFEEENNEKSVRERLIVSAGINPEKHKCFEDKEKIVNEQDKELREIVNKRIHNDLSRSLDVSMLVRNFHWVVMRARRLRKMTVDELAERIAEPKELLVFIERGQVSEKNIDVLKKLELFLGIELFTKEAKDKKLNKEVLFDSIFSRAVTVDDLKELKEKGFRNNQPKNF